MSGRRVLAAAAAAVVVAACSGGGGEEATTTTVPEPPPVSADPCALVTDEAVGALSDLIERPGTSDEVSGEHTCAWRNINGVAVVSLRVGSVGSDTVDEEIRRIGLAGDRYVVIDGVGDEALAVFRGNEQAGIADRVDRIVARSGANIVELRLPGLDVRDTEDPVYVTAVDVAGQARGRALIENPVLSVISTPETSDQRRGRVVGSIRFWSVPELPEVETVRRGIEPLVTGCSVVEAWGHPSPKFFGAVEAAGAQFGAVGRRGKYLLFGLDDGHELVVHLGMTGQLSVCDELVDDPHVRAWWQLDDGRVLTYRDVRRFGRLGVVRVGEYERFPTLASLGPEPWDPALDDGGLWRNLRGSRARLKTRLLSQRPIAGVGNIYADEALSDARIDPSTRTVGRERSDRLLTALRRALEQGLEHGGTTLRDYRNADGGTGENQRRLRCYGRSDEPCLRCGEALRRKIVDGRSTAWCEVPASVKAVAR